MELKLKRKRVLVTGASRGIGLEIANTFHQQGCKVVVNSRDINRLRHVVQDKQNYFAVAKDVTDPLQAAQLVDEAINILGEIDVLVCNVGSGKSVKPGTETFHDWQKSMSINLFSATNVIEAAIPNLQRTKGAIVCISSICGDEVVKGAPITYSAAKAALNAYIRGVSVPLARDQIRINGVAPGNILFQGSSWEKKLVSDPKAVNKMLVDDVPLATFGSPSDVASLVLWLASPLARFVTGAIYTTDGGQTRR